MNDREYLAFDLEIAKAIPEGETDWKNHRPLGISCAAILASTSSSEYLDLFAGRRWRPWQLRLDENPAHRMNAPEAQQLVGRLAHAMPADYIILTWNGLGFDFDILAEESGRWEECCKLALNHIDMMFHFFCLRGHALSLDKAAKGMGLAGKPEGMDGSMAPKLWAEGRHQEVLDYLAQDVKTTLELARAVEEAGYIEWVSNAGYRIRQAIDRWLTVRECLELPRPDTCWITDPWPREKFTGWMNL